MASLGAGRPVDHQGVPEGPWTPELLADEISRLDANTSGIDLRTVQHWFQDNQKGISVANIRWLARVFGCGDPEATSLWQAELSASQARLIADRRKTKKVPAGKPLPVRAATASTLRHSRVEQQTAKFNIAKYSEAMFLDERPFSAIVLLWAFTALLIFIGHITGTHLVTYEPVEGVTKQVGLFWSPNWILDKLIWLPILIIVAAAVLRHWRDDWRPKLLKDGANADPTSLWDHKIETYFFAFWAILFVSVAITFLLQWLGSYVLPLTRNSVGDRVVDWLLVGIEKPDVISTTAAIIISAIANLMSGISYWFLFVGLMLLYVVATDFNDVTRKYAGYYGRDTCRQALGVGTEIIKGIYCITVLALLISTQIKLVAVYLMTDAQNIWDWLIGDAYGFFGVSRDDWNWFDKSPTGSITSFFVLFIPCFVFAACCFQVRNALARIEIPASTRDMRGSWLGMAVIITLLFANYWLIGKFSGFSVLMFVSLAIATCSLISQVLRNGTQSNVAG